ncbi:MAG: FixH family protein [Ignavibacteria bacterium]
MKMSWGKGIVISIVLFFIITTVMVLIAFMQKVDLVVNNYYEKELTYQERIDVMKNSSSLKGKINVSQSSKSVDIQFPDSLDYNVIMGNIKFYRPSDSDKDFSLPIKLDEKGIMSVISDKISKGMWKIQINWTMKDKNYFSEESLMVQ